MLNKSWAITNFYQNKSEAIRLNNNNCDLVQLVVVVSSSTV